MNNRDKILLSKILDDTLDISQFVKGHDYHSFFNNRMMQNAVVMSLIKIGERAGRLSEDIRVVNNHIPWNKIIRLRHKAAHEYEALRMPDIWINATEDVPIFMEQIKEIVDKENEQEMSDV